MKLAKRETERQRERKRKEKRQTAHENDEERKERERERVATEGDSLLCYLPPCCAARTARPYKVNDIHNIKRDAACSLRAAIFAGKPKRRIVDKMRSSRLRAKEAFSTLPSTWSAVRTRNAKRNQHVWANDKAINGKHSDSGLW